MIANASTPSKSQNLLIQVKGCPASKTRSCCKVDKASLGSKILNLCAKA